MNSKIPLIAAILALALVTIGGTTAVVLRVREVARQTVTTPVSQTSAGNFKIGDRMPDFELTDPSGARKKLSSFIDGKQFVVINFHHPDCPCAASCGRLVATMVKEGYKDMTVLGILSAGADDERVQTALTEQRAEGIINYPIFHDPNGALRAKLGAQRTPEIWVLDREGRIAYWGAPENTLYAGGPKHRFLLREAIDALRAGKSPAIVSYEPIGCPIDP